MSVAAGAKRIAGIIDVQYHQFVQNPQLFSSGNYIILISPITRSFTTGKTGDLIVADRALRQISDAEAISEMVEQVLEENPNQVAEYLGGKETIANWLFGQVMRATKGKANPQVVEQELNRKLEQLKS